MNINVLYNDMTNNYLLIYLLIVILIILSIYWINTITCPSNKL